VTGNVSIVFDDATTDLFSAAGVPILSGETQVGSVAADGSFSIQLPLPPGGGTASFLLPLVSRAETCNATMAACFTAHTMPTSVDVALQPGVYSYARNVVLHAVSALSFSGAGGAVANTTTRSGGDESSAVSVALAVQPAEGVNDTLSLVFAPVAAAAAPATLAAAVPTASGNTALQSISMFFVDVQGAEGNSVAASVHVNMSFDIENAPGGEPPQFWYLDPATDNAWHLAPNFTVTAVASSRRRLNQAAFTTYFVGAFIDTASGGLYYNTDRAFRTSCLVGTLPAGCGGVHVQASGPDGIVSHGFTNTAGQFCVEGPPAVDQYGRSWSSALTVPGFDASVGLAFPTSAGRCAAPSACSVIPTASLVPLENAVCPPPRPPPPPAPPPPPTPPTSPSPSPPPPKPPRPPPHPRPLPPAPPGEPEPSPPPPSSPPPEPPLPPPPTPLTPPTPFPAGVPQLDVQLAYHGWTSPVPGCSALSPGNVSEGTAIGGVYYFTSGDSLACKAWKLAATICTTQPINYYSNMDYVGPSSYNFYCPQSACPERLARVDCAVETSRR